MMRTNKLKSGLLMLSLLLASGAGTAEDIDLYVGGEGVTGASSNVLLMLDNSTNWAAANQGWPVGKQGEAELRALSEIVGTLGDDINLGLLLSAGSNGGYIRFAMREMSTANKVPFQSMFNTMVTNFGNDGDNDDKVNTASIVYDNMMNTAFRYFNGKARFGTSDLPSGSALDLRDYDGNINSPSKQPAFPSSLGSYSLSSNTATTYSAPSSASEGCAKNYIIFIGNGYPNSAGTASDLTNAGALVGVTPDVSNVSGGDNDMYADEWARFMNRYGVKSVVDDPNSTTTPKAKLWNKIVTYTIDVCKDQCDSVQGQKQATLLKSMAKSGGGRYFRSTNNAEIKAALEAIFAEIQSVNGAFASAALPISVNTQNVYINQVYIGMFRPDGAAGPRWFGNLKGYKNGRYCDLNGNGYVDYPTAPSLPSLPPALDAYHTPTATDERYGEAIFQPKCINADGVETTIGTYLADKNGFPAIDSRLGTGFIDASAISYWTTDSNFWAFDPTASGIIGDLPDGPLVERGAAAQRLRATWGNSATSPHPDGRKVYTCLSSCLSASPGDSARSLSNNAFVSSNSAVATALAAPSGSVSVTLARSGNTVTATSSTAHGFAVDDYVNISGATPTAYNSTFRVVTVPDSTHFTLALSETPATTDTVTVATQGLATATNGSLSTTTAGALATVTVQNPSNLVNGALTATISGASLSVLNGVFTGTVVGNQFTYAVTLPANPTTPLSGTVSVKCGTNATETATATWSAATGKFTFTRSPSGNFVGCKNHSGSISVSGAADARYNGVWTVAAADKGTSSFSAGTLAAQPAVSNSYAMTITLPGLTYTGTTLSRTLGSQTVTGTKPGGHSISTGVSIVISEATDTSYNGVWTVTSATGTTFTFTGPSVGPATPPTGTITATPAAAVTGGPTTANLINWMRGKDLWEDENFNQSLTDVRASIHGDVLHSEPAIVSYGASGIYGFYGSNDGFLRAIKAGQGATDGLEQWAFIPEEFMNYNRLARLYSNSTKIRYPNLQCGISPTPSPRNYFWDGPLAVIQDVDSGVPTKTWLFAGMRRGGKSYYAFDVTNPQTPKVMWRITNSGSFAALGQTWSKPIEVLLKHAAETTCVPATSEACTETRALVFGGGYDPTTEDLPSGTSRPEATSGYGVFVVNAETGALIKHLLPPSGVVKRSIPGDVRPVGKIGYLDRIYAGDTGGNLLRFDTDTTAKLSDATYWKSYRIAKLGDVGGDGGIDDRKFMGQPLAYPYGASGYNVLLGTGNREKPLANKRPAADSSTTSITNTGGSNTPTCAAYYGGDAYYGAQIKDRFYAVLDTAATPDNSAPVVEADLKEINSSPTTLTKFDLATDVAAGKKGWFINLNYNGYQPSSYNWWEEKAVNSPRDSRGLVYYATNSPRAADTSAGACSNLGVARLCAVDPYTGLPAFNRDQSQDGSGNATLTAVDYCAIVEGGGLPPTPTVVKVITNTDPGTADNPCTENCAEEIHDVCIGCGGDKTTTDSAQESYNADFILSGRRSRLYWYYGAD